MDEFSAEFNRSVREAAFGVDAPSDAIARFQHDDCMARIAKIASGSKPGRASADDEGCHKAPHFGKSLSYASRIVQVSPTVKQN